MSQNGSKKDLIRHLGMHYLPLSSICIHTLTSFLIRPAWHCIAGPEFAAYVTHEAKTLVYFNMLYIPPPKKSTQSQTVGEDDLERRKDTPPLAFWHVLLFKAG